MVIIMMYSRGRPVPVQTFGRCWCGYCVCAHYKAYVTRDFIVRRYPDLPKCDNTMKITVGSAIKRHPEQMVNPVSLEYTSISVIVVIALQT